MALPDPENLAYRGITSGNAGCIAYRGFICDAITQVWQEIITFTLYIKRLMSISLER